jgi:hypothetical protein
VIKWKIEHVAHYSSGGFCQQYCDRLGEQVRTVLKWFVSVGMWVDCEMNCFQFIILVQAHSTRSPQATRCPGHAVLSTKTFEIKYLLTFS